LKIILYLDVPFSQQFIPVIQVAKANFGCWLGVGPSVHDISDDDIVGGNADVDGQGFFVAEFVVFDGVLDQGLEGDRGDEEILCGEIGDLDDHADGFGEADLQEVEVVADEFHLFAEQNEVSFFITEDIAVDAGEGIVVEPGVLWVTGDEKGQGIEGIEDKMGIDLVFERFQFGLGLGDVELFDLGFVVFFFEVEEDDLVDIADKAGGDNEEEDGVDQVVGSGLWFIGSKDPKVEQAKGEGAGIDDVGEEESDYNFVIGCFGPGYPGADIVHEADVAFPDQEDDDDKEEVGGCQFGIGVKAVCDKTRYIWDEDADRRDAYYLNDPVVQSKLFIHSRFRLGGRPNRVKLLMVGKVPGRWCSRSE
jgi:hypothetical protein